MYFHGMKTVLNFIIFINILKTLFIVCGLILLKLNKMDDIIIPQEIGEEFNL